MYSIPDLVTILFMGVFCLFFVVVFLFCFVFVFVVFLLLFFFGGGFYVDIKNCIFPIFSNWHDFICYHSIEHCRHWPRKVGGTMACAFKQGKYEGFESCDRPIVRKRPIWVKIGDVLSRVTLKFDGWPWKTIGHLSCAVSSFVQHFIAIGEFKLELQSANAQSRSKSTIFLAVWPWNLTYDLQKQQGTSSMLLQALCSISYPLVNSNWSYSPETSNLGQNRRFVLAVWPWNLTDDLKKQKGTSPKHYQAICIISSSYVNSNWSYSPETPNLGQIRQFLEPRDLKIWRMTFKNNRAPLLCYLALGSIS